jgi:hypothetical protein
VDAIEEYGTQWLDEVYQFIIEDQKRDLVNQMILMPLARTAMGKEDGRALQDYQKHVARELEKMTPWVTGKRSDLSGLRKKVKSGTTVVIPDASDGARNPLYKDAAIRKDS